MSALFDADTLAVTEEAIVRSVENADVDWLANAMRAIHVVAMTTPLFTSDEVWQWLEDNAPDASTHSPSAIGGVFRRAADAGWITKTATTRKSKFSRRHRDLTVWASKLVEGAA